jgi:transcriptional regulator GlxA family with amidase domain
MSRRPFERLFLQVVGRTPYDELLRIRLQHAKELLANSDPKVGEIALQTGFTSLKQLSQMFHRKTGQLPTAYRARARVP